MNESRQSAVVGDVQLVKGGYRLAISLFTKGAINHVHRRRVIDELTKFRISVSFIVREDYWDVVERYPDCNYLKCAFQNEGRARRALLNMSAAVRRLSPANDSNVRRRMRLTVKGKGKKYQGLRYYILEALARYGWVMSCLVFFEGFLIRKQEIVGVSADSIDQLLVLGLGTSNTEMDGRLCWWAKENGIPVVHLVINYDGLSTKGFRGVPVDRLLVWGPSMRDDAQTLQRIPMEKVTVIGAVRYDRIEVTTPREQFLKSRGLDPNRKTLVFAGSIFTFHYFEMLDVLSELREKGRDYQLILRMYPDKKLLTSPQMRPLVVYANSVGGVYVSIGDPNYQRDSKGQDVLYIEEDELWHVLSYADVVINLYSTIALEACLLNIPVINLWYFDRLCYCPGAEKYPRPSDIYIHHRKLLSYKGTEQVYSRREMMEKIEEALERPDLNDEGRKRVVAEECGPVDGLASSRLAQECSNAYWSRPKYSNFSGLK